MKTFYCKDKFVCGSNLAYYLFGITPSSINAPKKEEIIKINGTIYKILDIIDPTTCSSLPNFVCVIVDKV